jgi:hypothetical protein
VGSGAEINYLQNDDGEIQQSAAQTSVRSITLALLWHQMAFGAYHMSFIIIYVHNSLFRTQYHVEYGD